MASLVQEFVALTEALNQKKIDYAVCGGLAMTIHGFTRATLDIDLLVLSKDLSKAWTTAQSLGYVFEGLPMHFHNGAIEIRRISKVDKESKTLFTVDFLLVTDELKDVWENRLQIEWDEGQTWVVSREGLKKLKTIAGRPQDLVDIERLENEAN